MSIHNGIEKGLWTILSYIICLFLFINSCTMPNNGCVDSFASNFDLEADEDCCAIIEECCCTYPSLNLSMTYLLRSTDTVDTNFKLNTFYELDDNLDSIRIDTFLLFISDVNPINIDLLDTIQVIETIEFNETNSSGEVSTISIEDNLALLDFNQFSYSLGTYQGGNDVDQIDLIIGLPESIAQLDPDDIITDHELIDDYISLYDETLESYSAIKLIFTIKEDEQEREISQLIALEKLLSFSVSNPILLNKGEQLTILVKINVLDVFKGIIFDMNTSEISQTIVENIENTISIIE